MDKHGTMNFATSLSLVIVLTVKNTGLGTSICKVTELNIIAESWIAKYITRARPKTCYINIKLIITVTTFKLSHWHQSSVIILWLRSEHTEQVTIIVWVWRNTASDTSDTSDTSESNYILGRGEPLPSPDPNPAGSGWIA